MGRSVPFSLCLYVELFSQGRKKKKSYLLIAQISPKAAAPHILLLEGLSYRSSSQQRRPCLGTSLKAAALQEGSGRGATRQYCLLPL